VLLFAVFGSVLVPIKAIVLNLLSLTATFGAMVWIFQDGHLSGVLDFTATGQLDVAMPVLMFCIAFGLSMDYEVFLLSRIKEEHDRTGDNTQSVATGLERTGRLITAAAAILAISFAAFGTAGMSFMKLMGIGLALAIVMDATIIRGLLVPAFMRLAGEANWWAPAPLARLHRRWGINETPDPPAEELVPEPEPEPLATR
jgi:RND superfamily putative drug exporter